MGVWHIYKQASIQVYRLAGAHFLAPFFHHSFPDRKFYAVPKLRSITYRLSLVRLSYPYWRKTLRLALQDDLPVADRQHLRNLKLLVEYFIPLVCFLCLSMSFAWYSDADFTLEWDSVGLNINESNLIRLGYGLM